MPLFAATDLTCLRGERLVFQELSFAVEAGGAWCCSVPTAAANPACCA